MSHYKDEAKEASHAKMKRMGLHGKQKDASFDDVHPYDGVPPLDSGLAGMRPIGKQRFRRGGKVAHAVGKEHKGHLGHRPRKGTGGPGLGGLNMGAPSGEDLKKRLPPDMSNINNPNMQASPKIPSITPPPRPPEFSAKPMKQQPMTTEEAEQFMRSGKAGGGALAGNPNARKIVAALAMRKKKAGLPYAPPGRTLGTMPAAPMLGRKKGGAVHEDVAEDKKLIKSMVKGKALKHHDHEDKDEMCWGGRSKRASGGRTGKGKTTINVMVGAPHDSMSAGAGAGSPPQQAMQPKPPGPPMPPPGMPPMGGMPGMPGGMPPMGGGAPMGGMPGAMGPKPPMPMPGMPMGRKSGGRTMHQETEYGSGSGLGRLEKTKWPLAGATRKGGK